MRPQSGPAGLDCNALALRRLLVNLQGGPPPRPGAGGSPRKAPAAAAAVPPLVLRNDVNLLQILDTVKLMMEY